MKRRIFICGSIRRKGKFFCSVWQRVSLRNAMCVLVPLCFCCMPLASARKADLFKRFELSTAARFMNSSAFLPEKYAFYTGSGLVFRDFELKAAYKIPETSFSRLPEWDGIAFGAAFSLKELLGAPLVVKGGGLSLGGSFYKLKNPLLSSASNALSVPYVALSGVTASLPSISANRKPLAIGAEFNYRKRAKANALEKIGAATYWGSDKLFAASVLTDFALPGRTAFGVALTAVNAPVQAPRSYSGRKLREYLSFPDGRWSGSAQAAFRSPVFRTKCTAFLFQSLRMPAVPVFASENSLHIGLFDLNVAGFYAVSENTLTASARSLRTLTQIKLNPQFNFPASARGVQFKSGVSLLLEEKKRHPTKRKPQRRAFMLSFSAAAAADWRNYSSSVMCTVGGFYLGDSTEHIFAGIVPPEKLIFENVSYGLRWRFAQKAPPSVSFSSAFEVTPSSAYKEIKTCSKLAASVQVFQQKRSDAADVSLRGAISVNTLGERVRGNAEIDGIFKWKNDKFVLNALLGVKYRF